MPVRHMPVRPLPVVGVIAQVALFAVLAITVGLTGLGWVVGLASAAGAYVAVARGLTGTGATNLGPADRVTLVRAILACGVAALVADSFLTAPALRTVVAIATVALVLDAVDGWVARRTRTASMFGARFDGEVDAFLIGVLSVYVASVLGW